MLAKNNTKNYTLKQAATAFALLSALLLVLLTLAACSGGTEGATTDIPDGTTALDTSSTAINGTAPESETTHIIEYPVVDPESYEGLFISRVYGNGGKADAAAEHSFIELYNSTDRDISLFGLSLYFKSTDSEFARFCFAEDALIPSHGFYLVRGAAAVGYYQNLAVLHIESFDAEWNYYLDNNCYELMLAPVHTEISPDSGVLTHKSAISSIITIPDGEYHPSIYAVDNMSKNKVAVRTSLTQHSGFHKVNLTKLTSTELASTAPRSSVGTNPTVLSRLNEVTFSMPAGIYEKQFKLALSAPDGYTIYYTVNGSDPRVAGNKYQNEIAVRDSSEVDWRRQTTITSAARKLGQRSRPVDNTLIGGLTIKAYATNGTDSTPVYTSTYFVVPELLELDYTVMAMSLPVEELVGEDGFYVNYGSGLDTSRPRGLATMEVFDTDGVRVGYSNVELAVSGHGSAGWGMKSLRVYYKGSNNTEGGLMSDLEYDLFEGRAKDKDGQAITSFSRILLRNSGNDTALSMFRDAYMQSASAGLGVDYMEYEPVFLFINGEFWGVYNARERYSGEYVESHYGVDKDNVTILENDYSQVTTNVNAPYVVSSGLQSDADHFNRLVAFIRSNDLTDKKNYDYVCSQMDVDSLIGMYISRLFFAAPDWPENNVKIWRNRNADDPSGVDTKWHFTLLDLDFGLTDGKVVNYANAFGMGSVCSSIMAKLITNEEFKTKFIVSFHEKVSNVITEERNLALFDKMADERLELMPYVEARWGKEGRLTTVLKGEIAEMRQLLIGKNEKAINGMRVYFRLTKDQLAELIAKSSQ